MQSLHCMSNLDKAYGGFTIIGNPTNGRVKALSEARLDLTYAEYNKVLNQVAPLYV